MNDTKECPTSETDYIFDIYSSGRYITFWNNYTYYEGETKDGIPNGYGIKHASA